MWKKNLLIQVCVCLFLVTCYITIGHGDTEILLEKRGQIVATMSEHYTTADIFNKGKDVVSTLIKTPSIVTGYIIEGSADQHYAEPIDPVLEGEITSVYAVSGGQVIEAGESEEMGRYIKIRHDEAVSIYGNCSRVYAKEGKHVRKGQVIGSYINDENKKFYYELIKE